MSNPKIHKGMIRIQIAYTGSFDNGGQKFRITENDLRDIERNMLGREVPVDYEHLSVGGSCTTPGCTKAAGWIRESAGIEIVGRDAGDVIWGMYAWFRPTRELLMALREKEYRYFSPEIQWSGKDERGRSIGTRLAAGAITNRPFLKFLPPITLTDVDFQQLANAQSPNDAFIMGECSCGCGKGKQITMNMNFAEKFATIRLSESRINQMSATEKLEHGTVALMSERGLTRYQAFREVARTYPELYEEYKTSITINAY